jgi:hypothetical protein
MKAPSSGNNRKTFLSGLAISAAFTVAIFGFVATPGLGAEIPPDQIKAASAIALTVDLLDKMDKAIKDISANDAAKAELGAIGKDASITPETWGSVMSAKCPKASEIFKSAGITPDEFAKGIFAMMAIAMSEELAKSEDKTVKANADFFAANKDKCNAVFSGFLMLGEPGPGSSPASTP